MDTDQNLLFGVLALQADAVTRSHFCDACALWANQKHKALADLLLEHGWITPEDKADIDRVLERKLRKHGGDARAGLAEVTTDAVRQVIVEIDDPVLCHSIVGETSVKGFIGLSTIAHRPEAKAGRYTLSRLHAKGGIGQVWLARDSTLGRDVALKELRPERAEQSELWARFLNEAQVTGQLEHPGIVPIYELGRKEGDQPFYTMRFVRGRTLGEALHAFHERSQRGEATPLELRELLNAFVGVCNAVAFAHSRGVIHRDLKPQNVVLGDFGEVIVLDWGLAKAGVVGAAAQVSALTVEPLVSGATLEGQVIGTPAYMAPEQADGRLDLLNQRTDVYGLGAMLYELLTGNVPFDGTSTTEVLQKVRHEQPPRPRTLNPSVPAALEAVCLKSLAKQSAQRYASAKTLATEVEHWLADEPVSAYAEPLPAQWGRWARRHRPLVASAAVLLLATAIASTLGVVLIGRKNVEIDGRRAEAQEAQRREGEQRRLAQAHFRKAREAVDKMLTRIGSERLLNVPMMEKLRRELLEEALTFNNDFLRVQSDDPEVRHELALAHSRLAHISHRLRQDEAADKAGGEAIAQLALLAQEFPDQPVYRSDLAAAHAHRAELPLKPGDVERECKSALTLRRELVARYPQVAEYRAELGYSLLLLFGVTRAASRHAEAEQAVREALDIFQRLAEEVPKRQDLIRGVVRSYHNLGIVLEETGRSMDAEAPFRKALEVQDDLALSDDIDNRVMRASNRRALGVYYARLSRTVDAEKLFQASVADYERLVADFPFSPDWQLNLATGYSDLAVVRARAGKFDDAEAYFRKNAEQTAKLVSSFPQVPGYRRNLGFARMSLAQVQLDTNRTEEAHESLRQALAVRQQLADEFPAMPDFRWDLSVTHSTLGRTLHLLGKEEAAEKHFRAAIEQGVRIVSERGHIPDYRHKLAVSRRTFADYLRDRRRVAEAEVEYRQALDAWGKLTSELPKVGDYRRQLALAHAGLAKLWLQAQQIPEATQQARQAVLVGEQLVIDSPAYLACQVELREYCGLLAAIQARTKQYVDAERSWRQALAIGSKLIAAEPRDSQHLAAQVQNLKTLACIQRDAGKSGEAKQSLALAQDFCAKLPPRRPDNLYALACIQALSSSLADSAESQKAADQALASLREAVKLGFGDVDRLKTDPDLESLRSRREFRQLLDELSRSDGPGRPTSN